jgi:hypothetical protein
MTSFKYFDRIRISLTIVSPSQVVIATVHGMIVIDIPASIPERVGLCTQAPEVSSTWINENLIGLHIFDVPLSVSVRTGRKHYVAIWARARAYVGRSSADDSSTWDVVKIDFDRIDSHMVGFFSHLAAFIIYRSSQASVFPACPSSYQTPMRLRRVDWVSPIKTSCEQDL